jgi:hypothetical protein
VQEIDDTDLVFLLDQLVVLERIEVEKNMANIEDVL